MKRLIINHGNHDEIIASAQSALSRGGLVVFPSDTVYGLAADALSKQAVGALLSFKERAPGKPVSIAVRDMAMLEQYVSVSAQNRQVLSTLLPGPFTAVLPSKHRTVAALEAEDGSLGVRIPLSPFVEALSSVYPHPYTATSANLSGKGPHYSIDALLHTLSEKKKQMIDLYIDAGELPHHPPSTVLNLQADTIQTMRGGSYTLRLIQTLHSHSAGETQQIAKQIIDERRVQLSSQPLVLLLQGNLGAGKTVFAQGIGDALGIKKRIVSPTYVLYYEYVAHDPQVELFHHFDLYRAQSKEDLELLGIQDILKAKAVIAMEWGEKMGSIQQLLQTTQATILLITITQEKQENDRLLQVYELSWN
ncbi:MAG: L-threonylcarbamoyladenylate synthase [Candidatus Roizmanbacteria bacterium]|nr:L-threonylcarbamoyladenylate synthase [Candidatus Roizmanbacteria bacterium]